MQEGLYIAIYFLQIWKGLSYIKKGFIIGMS